MDKINNVSFTGIKNIGYIKFTRPIPVGNLKEKSLSMVLTDDYRGQDLTAFLDVLKKIPGTQYGYKHPISKNILNIECSNLNGFNTLLINGRPIKVDDEHLSIFSYIAKLTKKIAGMKDNEMIVNRTYKEYEADDVLMFGSKVSHSVVSGYSLASLDYFFNKDVVRKGAQRVNEFVQGLMNDYFGIK